MELITAQTLWKDFDLRGLPLDETVLSTEIKEHYTVKYIYFNGEATTDGCARVFAQLYTPASIPTGASIVLMNDVSQPFDTLYVDFLCESGFTVLVVDYAGKRENGKYTIYPESMNYANFFGAEGGYRLPKTIEEVKNSAIKAYAVVMARAFVYLENQEGLDKSKIALMGVRRGSPQVFLASFLVPEACGAVSLFNYNSVSDIDITSPDATLYNTCLSPSSYVSITKVPTYIVEGSNNSDDSLFYNNLLFKGASEICRFYVAEHSDLTLLPFQRKSIMAFLNAMAFSHSFSLPKSPTIDAICSEHSLYYVATIDKPEKMEKSKILYFYGKERGAYRNWMKLHIDRVNEGEHIAKAPVFLAKEDAHAFVSVIYGNGFIVSSEIFSKIPALLGVTNEEIVRSRLVYDVEMGAEWWFIRNIHGMGEISIEETESGICGVTSSVNVLTSLKIGDVNTRGERDNSLQLLIYSEQKQDISIEVTCRNGGNNYVAYSCLKRPQSNGEWSKITISPDELRSENGVMRGWDDAVGITINSENKLLINSLLWI